MRSCWAATACSGAPDQLEDLGRARVEPLALGLGEPLVDGRAEHRVREAGGPAGAQDAGGGELGDRPRGLLPVEAGEMGDAVGAGVVAQHRDRDGERLDALGQAREPQRDRAGDRLGRDLARPARARGVGRHALLGERADQLAQQQRVAAGRLVHGGGELRRDLGAGELAGERAAGVGAEAARAQHLVGRGEQVGELGLERRAGAHREQDDHRQALDAAGEVPEPAERDRVGPLRVVDEQRQRLALGEVDGQPVERVQRGERRVLAVRAELRGAGLAQQPARGARGPGEQRLARGGVGARERRLEQLADDPVAVRALELAAARDEHAQPRGLRELAPGGEQPRLPDPRLALDRDHLPGRSDRPLQTAQLRVALQEKGCGCLPPDLHGRTLPRVLEPARSGPKEQPKGLAAGRRWGARRDAPDSCGRSAGRTPSRPGRDERTMAFPTPR